MFVFANRRLYKLEASIVGAQVVVMVASFGAAMVKTWRVSVLVWPKIWTQSDLINTSIARLSRLEV